MAIGTTASIPVSEAHYVAFMNLIAEQHALGGKQDGVHEQSDNLVTRCLRVTLLHSPALKCHPETAPPTALITSFSRIDACSQPICAHARPQ